MSANLKKILLKTLDGQHFQNIPVEVVSLYSKDNHFDHQKIQLQMLLDLLNIFNLATPTDEIRKLTNLRTWSPNMNNTDVTQSMFNKV